MAVCQDFPASEASLAREALAVLSDRQVYLAMVAPAVQEATELPTVRTPVQVATAATAELQLQAMVVRVEAAATAQQDRPE